MEELKYLQQARWQNFEEKERRLFEWEVPGLQGSTNDILLKVGSPRVVSLFSKWNFRNSILWSCQVSNKEAPTSPPSSNQTLLSF